MNVTLRHARPKDLAAMVRLLGELFEQEAEFQPDPQRQRRGLEAVLTSEALGRLLVAERAGDLVGMVTLLYLPSTALGQRVAVLEDLIVASTARARGIGSALLEHAIAQCRRDGCARITLLSDGDNARAHAVYERAGFSRSVMTPLRLLLDP